MAINITTIPAPYRAGFAKIKRLQPAEFELIASALENAPLVGGLKELTTYVLSHLPNIDRRDFEDILKSVFSLSVLITDKDTPLTENISMLSRAMQGSGRQDLTLSDDERLSFEARLARLLKINTLAISSKVQRLRLEYPFTFHNAIILTDMRPVFDVAGEAPLGCAISHTLRIGYHENADHKEFFVTLDDSDLGTLKKAIERAERKASSTRALIKLANLQDLS